MYLDSLTCWCPGLPPASGCTYTCFKHRKSTTSLNNPLLMLHFYSNILKPRELVQSSLDCLECMHKKVTSWRTPYLLSYAYACLGVHSTKPGLRWGKALQWSKLTCPCLSGTAETHWSVITQGTQLPLLQTLWAEGQAVTGLLESSLKSPSGFPGSGSDLYFFLAF